MKVFFIGAGPGDPELITCKGKRILSEADIVIYAGSLVNPKLLLFVPKGAELHDSSKMDFDEVTSIYGREKKRSGTIARLHTGDPSVYGAIQEQIEYLDSEEIPFEVVPGVSSVFAAAAELSQEFTLPGISQTLILTRIEGRTPVPEREKLAELSKHGTSMALFLSVAKIDEVVSQLKTGFSESTPAAVAYRVSWPDQRIILGTLADIASKVRKAGIGRQAIILVGEALRAQFETGFFQKSKLYDPAFSHGYRRAASASREAESKHSPEGE
jgi:precorrin-4/cobalt-precorrin-4 C11-methyltransferase